MPRSRSDITPAAGRRRARRSSVVGGAVLLAVVAAGSVLISQRDATRPERSQMLTPSHTSGKTLEVPAGQRTIVPDVDPDDLRGFDRLATVTSSQPEHAGDARLSTTVATSAGTAFVVVYCRGAADLIYLYEREDGAGGLGRCAPDADTILAPDHDIPDEAVSDRPVPLRMTMWLARPSRAWLDCWRRGTRDCDAVHGAPPAVADGGARFGFAVFEHRPAPVLRLFQRTYDAVSSIREVPWAIERAVIAAPGSGRLAFELPPSDDEHMMDVYESPSHHFETCRRTHADSLPDYETTQSSAYWAAVEATCGTALRLVVDDAPVAPDRSDVRGKGHFTELGAHLSPHDTHRIEVTVDRGDPRNVGFAVVVRRRTQLP